AFSPCCWLCMTTTVRRPYCRQLLPTQNRGSTVPAPVCWAPCWPMPTAPSTRWYWIRCSARPAADCMHPAMDCAALPRDHDNHGQGQYHETAPAGTTTNGGTP